MIKLIPRSKLQQKIKKFKEGGVPEYRYSGILNSGNKESFNIYISPEKFKVVKDVWKYLQEKKVSPRNAAVIMGNIMQESSFNRASVQKGGDSAEGFFQMHGDQLKEFRKWSAKNKTGRYPEIDYVLYMINSKDHPYTKEYNRVIQLPQTAENAKYRETIYGIREKNGTLYLIDDLHDAWNNDEVPLNDLTDLFTNTIERSGKPEYEKRRYYTNYFYDYFNKK